MNQLIRGNCNHVPTTGRHLQNAKLLRIDWSATGSDKQEVPFDFCVENFRVVEE